MGRRGGERRGGTGRDASREVRNAASYEAEAEL